MNSLFDKEILVDKLSKLNSTQQCIETLSHWCIFHRSKAEVVVSTWIEQFRSSEPAHKVPLLYLANDILQNSKRNGNEFVKEFWKVLPAAIKDVNENGVDHGKNVVSRLVSIWQERRVFGSQTQNLEDIMLGGELPPPLELGKKRSRSVKIVRRDSRSIRTKLSIGGLAEKIVTAFHLVFSDHSSENLEISNCKSAANHVRKMELDVDHACAQANPKRKFLANKLQEEENILKQSVEKLKNFEANRAALVTQLREALWEQECELENVHTQIQLAQTQAEEASNMRKRLLDENYIALSKPSINVNSNGGANCKKTAADMAAEVADKLAASSSSQLIMSSVLSTFAAEEAKNAGLTTATSSVPNSRTPASVSSASNSVPKADQPTPASDPNFYIQAPPPPPPTSTHPFQPILVHQPKMSSPSLTVPQSQYQLHANGPTQATMQSPSPTIQCPYQFPPNTPSQHYAQTAGGMKNAYGFSSLPPLPPGPPPLMTPQPQPPNVGPTVAPVSHPVVQVNPQQPGMPAQQQLIPMVGQPGGAPPSFRPLQPPRMVYYSQPYSQ